MKNKANCKSSTIKLLMFIFLSVSLLNSCKKENLVDPDVTSSADTIITPEKIDVQSFEVINLKSTVALSDMYTATFGGVSIELLKTSDSTLTFYVPDVDNGEFTLTFDLATIKFYVTKTIELNANQLVSDMFQVFDTQVASLNPSTPDEVAEINSLNQYKQEVLNLFNSLSANDKQQTALFYEANKELFKSFSSNTFTDLDAPTTLGRQSECPDTDNKSFYNCTAENLGNAAIGLKNSSLEFLKMIGMAGAMSGVAMNTSILGPVAWGITAVGISLPLGAAGYLLLTEVRPAAIHFKKSLFPFLEASWILGNDLFSSVSEDFQDQINTSLNLQPKFRSISSTDGNVSSGCSYFTSAMSSLSVAWNKLTSIFGSYPAYSNNETAFTILNNDISITNISNSNVQYMGNTGQSVKFRSLSGNEETFNYKISLAKEGFVKEKTVTGKVLAFTDSTEIYRISSIGNYTVNGFVGNGPNSELDCELKDGGVAVYTIYNDPSWTDGTAWTISWSIQIQDGKYYHSQSGWWNGYPNIKIDSPLSYPVSSFNYHDGTTYAK